jgi:hypothetical protein
MGDKLMKDTDTDTDLREAMQGLRPPTAQTAPPAPQVEALPGAASPKPKAKLKAKRPKAAATAKPGKPGPKPKPQPKAAGPARSKVLVPEILDENSENGISSENGIEDDKPSFDLKAQLTVKELKFIELYLVGDHNVETAMESAGYTGYHPHSLYRLGRRIVQKYESQAGDHRKIMRAMGYGESKIIELLIDSAEKAKSDMVKLNARVALAKCLGLNNDVVQTHLGVNIIITGRSQRPPGAVEGGGRPAQIHAVQAPKARQITK